MTSTAPISAPIVIAAGGTGGHLFPAQALAEELSRRDRKTVLITDKRGLKWKESFPSTNLHATRAATTERPGLWNKLKALMILGFGTLKALRLLGRYQPSVVIGFGGYPMLPTMFAGVFKRCATCLHEQNGVMGRANRLMAPRVDGIALTFPDPKGLPKKLEGRCTVTGNPVRGQVIEASQTPYPELTDAGPIQLVIFGGSQGAHIFSEVVPTAVALLPEDIKQRLQIVQQARKEDLAVAQEGYDKVGLDVELAPFFHNLPELMAEAHLVISRSGASTVCELTVLGRPAILVPLPGALDQDQAANARFLVESGGGWLMPQSELTAESLGDTLTALFSQPDLLTDAAAASKAQGRPGAVAALADMVEALGETGGAL